jgi:putative transposase
MAHSFLYLMMRALLGILLGRLRNEYAKDMEIAVLRHQLAILSRQIKTPKFSHPDRAVLSALSSLLPRRRWHVYLVTPATVMGWHRRIVARKWTYAERPVGRPALSQQVVELILRLGRENPRWGYRRIRGELAKLGLRVSATSIRTILIRNHLSPAPRKESMGWRQFLKAQASGIVACDFFTVETLRLETLSPGRPVLFFIEVGTRRVRLGGVTNHPNGGWMVQQARQFSMTAGEDKVRFGYLIHD